MTNYFTRTEYRQTDHNYQMIYNNLKTETVDEIENEIENYYSKYGSIFLNSIISFTILDCDMDSKDLKTTQRIKHIEKTCVRLLRRNDNYAIVNKIVKSVPVLLVAIGTFGCFVIEVVKLFLPE